MGKTIALLLLPLTLLGACELLDGSGDANVRVRTDRSVYGVGDTIAARVSNFTDQTLFFENCCGPLLLRVERWQDGGWAALPGTCIALCISVPAEVAAGATRTVRDTYLPTLHAPGRYRLTAHYWQEPKASATSGQASSRSFIVE